jgi:uncharacterized integral membrane protein
MKKVLQDENRKEWIDMQVWFISSLIFAILVATFAVSNSEIVTIRFMWKQVQLSQSIVILASAALGAMIVALIGAFSKVKSSFKIRELKKQVKDLEIRIEELQTDHLEAGTKTALEEIVAQEQETILKERES